MTHLFRSALALGLLAASLSHSAEPDIRPVPGQPVWEPQINVSMGEIAARMQYFDLVVLVNKGSSAQTINVYKNVGGQPREILSSRVSTGVEEYNCHYPVDKVSGWVSSKAIYTQTPAGFYTVANVDIDHYSGAYDDAHMPFAVFMYDPSGAAKGIATHIAPPGTESLIGHRESHGCMRLGARDAQEVFKQVLQTGGPINFDSDDMHARCNPAQSDPRDSYYCLRGSDTRAREAYYVNWLRANITPSPYRTAQLIPVLDRSGNYLKDNDGQIKMREGFKTLYIIENVETGTPTNLVYRGMNKTKGGGETAIYRNVQSERIKCRSVQALNDGRQNYGYYRGRPDPFTGFFGGFFGGR